MSSSEYLPIPIVSDILSRLPVKALVRLSSVCKSWYSLIRNPHFINAQFIRTVSDNANRSGRLLIMPAFNSENSCSVLCENTFVEMEKFNFPYRTPDRLYKMGNYSCNGLLCLTDGRGGCLCQYVYLFNPSIRKFKTLPSSSIADEIYGLGKRSSAVVGLGFHKATNDYKVVRIHCIQDEDLNFVGKVPPVVEVYSLNTDSWRRVGASVPYITYFRSVECNGAIHWLASKVVGEGWDVIVSFDLGDEVFQEIMLPADCFVSFGVLVMELLVLKGSLSLFVTVPQYEGSPPYHIWVMREYGITESWTKMYTIVPQGSIDWALGFSKNGKLILEKADGVMASWDPEILQLQDLGIKARQYLVDGDFLESLILLDGRNCFGAHM